MKEHRRFNRADMHTKGFFEYNGKIDFIITNVSLNGVLVEIEEPVEIEDKTDVSLIIQLSSSNLKIKTKSRLLHREDHHLGFRFEEIDVESMIHLRRLVELNSQTPDEIAEELLFLKRD